MKRHQSVVWLLIVLTGSVYIIELLVMLFLDTLPPMPKMSVFMLDAALLTTLTFPVFYFLVFRPLIQNITELQQAEEDLRTVSVAFESKDPILITDSDANILRANKMFLKITGYSSEEIIGKILVFLRQGGLMRITIKKCGGNCYVMAIGPGILVSGTSEAAIFQLEWLSPL